MEKQNVLEGLFSETVAASFPDVEKENIPIQDAHGNHIRNDHHNTL